MHSQPTGQPHCQPPIPTPLLVLTATCFVRFADAGVQWPGLNSHLLYLYNSCISARRFNSSFINLIVSPLHERQESFCYWPLSICQDVGDRRQLYKNCIVQTLLYSCVNSRVKMYKTFWERLTILLVVTFLLYLGI